MTSGGTAPSWPRLLIAIAAEWLDKRFLAAFDRLMERYGSGAPSGRGTRRPGPGVRQGQDQPAQSGGCSCRGEGGNTRLKIFLGSSGSLLFCPVDAPGTRANW
jgi:hypothetical protein